MTTTKKTRRPYPWTTTTKYTQNNDEGVGSNGGFTIPNDYEPIETTTKRVFPTYPTMWTSYWRKPNSTTVRIFLDF